ncbi:hypothetical protein VaNZ11_013813 [Volvox africanus]|uniref:Uncharacterized protein n=1 Tax=Volvox africanus TaxID=51714 RepID=A0ABQ5SIC8_9CHLO|nr:hypothetical protein VaNZ11_013813 [Volvox africanus]
MAGLRSIGGLAHLARCPCAGPIQAASQAHEAHWAWWISPLHATGFPGAAAPQGARQGSTYAAVGCDSSPHLSSGCSFPDPIIAPTFSSYPTVDGCAQLLAASPKLADTAVAKESLMLLNNTCISAASPFEESLALVLSPTQLGVQLWESAHAVSGLPWWAAIPACTLAIRCTLLPLNLRAYAASANIALLQRAFGLSGAVAEAVAAAEQQARGQGQREKGKQQAGEEAGAGQRVVGEATAHQPHSRNSSRNGGSTGGWELGRMDLVRRVFQHLRAQQGAPSFGWYVGNVMVQVPLVVSLSLALRRMSDTLWPGFTAEGLLYFQDLTAPPVYLQTFSTPYGTAGAILPLAIVLLYVSAADRSAGGSSPGIHMALKLLALPLYCISLLQPHAVLVYWLAQAATQLGLYELTARLPALRRAGGVPELLVAGSRDHPGTSTGTGEQGQAQDAGALDELLFALSESYTKSGNTAAARICLEALLARRPGQEAATKRLKPVLS